MLLSPLRPYIQASLLYLAILWYSILAACHKWGDSSSERRSDLPKVTQHAGIQSGKRKPVFWLQTHILNSHAKCSRQCWNDLPSPQRRRKKKEREGGRDRRESVSALKFSHHKIFLYMLSPAITLQEAKALTCPNSVPLLQIFLIPTRQEMLKGPTKKLRL